MTIAPESIFGKLPILEIRGTIRNHSEPLMRLLPDKRMRKVIENMMLGILGGQTPVITGMARQNGKEDGETWSVAKSMYRLLNNQRLATDVMYQGLYETGQRIVAGEKPEYLVVAVDPVNFEKPYTQSLEGVSVVHKATPPDLNGKARLTHGYPSITATLVNTKVPVTSYANWFSYLTSDFLSQNKEIEQAFTNTVRLYPDKKIRFVGDSGLDDQKMFAQVVKLEQEFVFRVSHLERIVEVYNDRLDRWETEKLQDLVESVPHQVTFQVLFKHAGKTRLDTIRFGWFTIRIPGTQKPLWIMVADDETLDRQLVLITNIPLMNVAAVQQVYNDWRLRTRIEHGYRFDHIVPMSFGKNKVWMWKTCASKPLTVCAVCSPSSSWPLKLSSSFLKIGRPRRFFGFGNWAANWASQQTATAPIGSCRASRLLLLLA
jgi:hypothetical protein